MLVSPGSFDIGYIILVALLSTKLDKYVPEA